MKKIDLTGQRFGRLTVSKEDEPHYTSGGNRVVKWICHCDCGENVSVSSSQLRSGQTKSCGCYQRERAKEANSKSLLGQKFGRLLVLRQAEDYIGENYSKSRWLCKCDCGNEIVVRSAGLTSGLTKSCGCLKSDINSKAHKKHNLSGTKIYRIYSGMKDRCFNKNDEHYSDYGGRGITICSEWLGEHGVEHFAKWAYENGFDENADYRQCTIDRINVNGNYEPSNCRWATQKEQCNNWRKTKRYEYNGEFHTLSEWADITGLNYHMLKARVTKYGYTMKEAIETPKYTRFSKLKSRNKND